MHLPNKLLISYCLLLATVLFSCTGKEKDENTAPYFSLKEYFTAQASLLNAAHCQAEKTVTKGATRESKINAHIDWMKELKPFMEADLNKPAWKNSFTSDSIITPASKQITYNAIEANVPVKKLVIVENAAGPEKIYIEMRKENKFYSSLITMEYFPSKGYSVHTFQEAFLSKPDFFDINVSFIK